MFLEKLINRQFGSDTAQHESTITKWQMMLGNMRNDLGAGDGLLRAFFHRSRDRRLTERGEDYVDTNPFLCPRANLKMVRQMFDPLSRTLELRETLRLDAADLSQRANPSQGGNPPPDQGRIDFICGELASIYGY